MSAVAAVGGTVAREAVLQQQRVTAVAVENGELRVSPLATADVVAALPAGSVVHIAGAYGDCRLVADPYGRRGWVPIRSIRALKPGAERGITAPAAAATTPAPSAS